MKLATVERPIERISTTTERQFTIKATGKAFRVLSSGLYKDKILAIIRELSCNAYDAHVSAGIADRPFDIHLPNPLEPFFSVRDYGPALSPHQIESVFATYFESTKTDSNDQIGGFGLGCKSPLSYVDSFTVVSRFEGVKRTYTVFVNEEETPSIVQMAEEIISELPVWEERGLAVRLPVRSENFREFKEKAEKALRYFTVQPVVVGSTEFKVDIAVPVFSGRDYHVCEGNRQSRAIMGVVAYPIDAHSLNLNSISNDLVRSSVDIYFNVGDLDITAGREELSYDRITKEFLSKRIAAMVSEIPRLVIKKFAKCPNEYEARKLYAKIVRPYGFVSGNFPDRKIPYKGTLIDSSSYSVDLKAKFPTMTVLHFDMGKSKTRYTTHSASTYRDTDRLRIEADSNLTILYDDLQGLHTPSRITRYREDHPNANVYVIRTEDPLELSDFITLVNGVQIGVVSALPKMEPKPRRPTSVQHLSEWERKSGNAINSTSWEPIDVNVEDGGIYVATKSGAVQYGSLDSPAVNFGRTFQMARKLGLFDPAVELYSIPKSLAKEFIGESNWVNFFDHVRDGFVAKMKAENWSDDIAKSRSLQKFNETCSTISGERGMLKKIGNELGKEHPLGHFLTMLDDCQKAKDYENQRILGDQLGVSFGDIAPSHDLCAAWELSGAKYPLLEYVFSVSRWERKEAHMVQQAVEYILICDRATNCVPTAA